MRPWTAPLLGLVFAAACFGQRYEIGAAVGYGAYNDGTVFSPLGTATAGIRNRFAAGIELGDELTDYISVEFSYLYHDGHPFLKAPGVNTDIQGNSDALTVEALFHFRKRDARWRPFLEGGAGAKDYVIAGPAPFPQPIPLIARLTTNDVWKAVFVAGGGIEFRPHDHILMRGEFRDYITTFPRTQIVPAGNNTARGIFEQFTPLFGLSYTF